MGKNYAGTGLVVRIFFFEIEKKSCFFSVLAYSIENGFTNYITAIYSVLDCY